jgi:phosphatidylserine/phosphatidylglycerophosphate/cardiolipin synthase-like enzyme
MSFLFRCLSALTALASAGAVFADTAPLPPRFKQPVVVAFNNNYLGLVEENIPVAMADPANTEKYLFALMDTATSTLEIAFYDITDLPAVDKIIKAHQRGIKVRVITDTDNMRDKEDPTKPSEASRRLRRAKVPVQDDRRGAFMHHKFVVADGEAVWLGSMNLTPTSIYEHNNNGVIIRSKRIAANFQAEFERLFNDRSFSGAREPVPFPETTIGGAAIRTYFSPNGGIREAILNEIKKARKSIQVMAFVFTDNELADAMLARQQKGVVIEGVFDECLIDSRSHYYTFRNARARVRRDGNQALMHHKVIVIDGKTVITGSYNFTNAAEQYNNESVVFITSRDIATAYADEFSRLMDATYNNRNLPNYNHPACRRGARD